MPAPSLVGVIPPIPAWAGNRDRPSVLKFCACSRCGDVTLTAWKAIGPDHPAWWVLKTSAAVVIRDLCAWCWMADRWELRQARAMAPHHGMTVGPTR